jgi:hypothetical protein
MRVLICRVNVYNFLFIRETSVKIIDAKYKKEKRLSHFFNIFRRAYIRNSDSLYT